MCVCVCAGARVRVCVCVCVRVRVRKEPVIGPHGLQIGALSQPRRSLQPRRRARSASDCDPRLAMQPSPRSHGCHLMPVFASALGL